FLMLNFFQLPRSRLVAFLSSWGNRPPTRQKGYLFSHKHFTHTANPNRQQPNLTHPKKNPLHQRNRPTIKRKPNKSKKQSKSRRRNRKPRKNGLWH
ncbi:hypothetical protein, partial [Bacillus sp. T2.9-1]|uniref:hypothetical protein n=1 Tax=Bacillus sp. T2.9-1 TaxID=3041163 RepID=UPI00253FB499